MASETKVTPFDIPSVFKPSGGHVEGKCRASVSLGRRQCSREASYYEADRRGVVVGWCGQHAPTKRAESRGATEGRVREYAARQRRRDQRSREIAEARREVLEVSRREVDELDGDLRRAVEALIEVEGREW